MLKTIFSLLILALFISGINSQTVKKNKKQISLYAGMGVDYGITPDFNDYLVAAIPYSTGDSIRSFNAGIEFFGGFEYELSKTISAKLDYSYFIRSLSYTYSPAIFDYTINSHQPYLFVNYLIKKDHFVFKFGLGAGYHFQNLDNKVNNSTTISYTSGGPSIRGEVSFMPMLSKGFYGYISGFAFGNFYGKLK
ncbi:MAG: hypothetical protein IT281_04030, partial [Ignavibacteria bacterium]|nr:hypothetical protein [Ignavibacteria bacterium]